jgi:uncharacterized membrane protein
VTTPGGEPLFADGPLAVALAVAGVGGTLGSLIGSLVGLGIQEDEAKRLENRVKEGSVLLAVSCYTEDDAARVRELLSEIGADDISSVKESASIHTA